MSSRDRRVIGVVVVAVAALIGILVVSARSGQGEARADVGWRDQPLPPRGAVVDGFDDEQALDAIPGFAWSSSGGSWLQQGGNLISTSNTRRIATVDAGSVDVLVHARVIETSAGGGVVLSSTQDGSQGLWLVAGPSGQGWQLWEHAPGGNEVLRTFDAPTSHVVVQVVRMGSTLKVAFDGKEYGVEDLPDGAGPGTSVGVVSTLAGTAFDLFGYLPLDAG